MLKHGCDPNVVDSGGNTGAKLAEKTVWLGLGLRLGSGLGLGSGSGSGLGLRLGLFAARARRGLRA